MSKIFRRHWMSSGTALLAATIVAALACGAAPAKKKTKTTTKAKSSAPLEPESYDPRVSLAPLVEKVSPAVVNIRTKAKPKGMGPGLFPFGNDPFEWFFGPRTPRPRPSPNPTPKPRSLGSGFIIDSKGLVVTNNHVVEGADEIEVQLDDERKFQAELVGSDDRTDVALLRLKNAKNLPTVKLGNSDALKVGDHVVAIGNPFGLDHTVTSGIVSAKERVIGAGPYDDFIQTDASINPGNSGGPLFNLKGEVIGINTAINPMGQGIGFAIPSSLASGVIEALESGGEVVRGWLGISFQPVTDDLTGAFGLKDKTGVVVANVTSGSPAEAGGMKAGDVITSVQGKKISEARDLPGLVARLRPGTTAAISVIRNGKPKTLKIKIGKMPDDSEETPMSAKTQTTLGFKVRDLDDRTKKQLGAESIEGGVVVTDIERASRASDMLEEGDIILEVNRTPVRDVKEFKAETKKLKSGDDLVLRVYRQGSWLWLAFRL
jgi:serine protease Do